MKRSHDSTSSSPARKHNQSPRTLPVQCEPTKITDLVDDCLFEVYKHLDIVDLTTIADVCQRLRSASKLFFVHSKFGVLDYPPSIFTKEQTMHCPIDQLLLQTSKVLRNFGAFVTTFDESYNTSSEFCRRLTKRDLCKFSAKIIQLLQKYCGESLIVLKLHHLGFTNAIAPIREPIFPRVQTFEWKRDKNRSKVKALLSTWFPEMREIWIGDLKMLREAAMQKHFKNLTKATLGCGWHNLSIGRFLMRNPQLKELHLFHRVDVTDFRVLEYVGKYTKDIEVLRLANMRISRFLKYPTTFNYFNELKKLKCFVIRETHWHHPKVPLIVRSIASAGIPLKSLTIDHSSHFNLDADLVMRHIIQLKSLEALDLGVKLNSRADIIRICTQLDQLRELSVEYGGVWKTIDVLDIMQVATKLQWLYARGRTDFDANTYEQLKNVVDRRDDNSQFVLRIREPRRWNNEMLDIWNYGREFDIEWSLPSEWYSRIGLEQLAVQFHYFREWELAVCTHICTQQHEDLTEFPIRFKNEDIREPIEKHRRAYGLPLLDSSAPNVVYDIFQ